MPIESHLENFLQEFAKRHNITLEEAKRLAAEAMSR